MYVYRVIDEDSVIVLQTTNRKEAWGLAISMNYARIETRRERIDGPKWGGNNFGQMEYVQTTEVSP